VKKKMLASNVQKGFLALTIAVTGLVGFSALGASAATPAQSEKAITTDWVTFFNGKSALKKQETLIQNGTVFTPTLKSQAAGPLAPEASAKVVSITHLTASTATVKFSLYLSGTLALPNQTGHAVLQNGIWKVSDSAFCGLLKLQGVKPKVCAAY